MLMNYSLRTCTLILIMCSIVNRHRMVTYLDHLFCRWFVSGKVLMACETAVRSFQSILMVVGGKQERDRGR